MTDPSALRPLPTELGAALASDPGYMDCVTRKFTTFAVGRLLDAEQDDVWMTALSERTLQAGGSLTRLIREVVRSELFRSAR